MPVSFDHLKVCSVRLAGERSSRARSACRRPSVCERLQPLPPLSSDSLKKYVQVMQRRSPVFLEGRQAVARPFEFLREVRDLNQADGHARVDSRAALNA
jgi:hypothetical protein